MKTYLSGQYKLTKLDNSIIYLELNKEQAKVIFKLFSKLGYKSVELQQLNSLS